MRVDIRRIDDSLPLPAYHSAGAAAFDLTIREAVTIAPGEIALLPANLIVKVPEGMALLILPRSSLPKRTGLEFPHSIGLIDQDYHGPDDELKIQVRNVTSSPVTVNKGDRIAQGLFVPIERAEWNEVDSHNAQTRGGFGSTGA